MVVKWSFYAGRIAPSVAGTATERTNMEHETETIAEPALESGERPARIDPRRTLGASGIEVSPLGLGCWAIGGVWTYAGGPGGWGEVDDRDSILALRHALELGVTFFDTAANYGAGHSEILLGRAFARRRDDIVIATKFGHRVDESSKEVDAYSQPTDDVDVARHVRADLQQSLRRLDTDYIDLYQLHVGELRIERALAVRDVLEQLVQEGLIRCYGWSTDDVHSAEAFAEAPGCAAIQHGLSALGYEDPAMLDLCERMRLASINRSPLGMGLLTGKFSEGTRFEPNDQRHGAAWHPGFADGRPTQEWLDRLAQVRDLLTSEGRTLAQGALGWIWARSPVTIPIPGFRTVAQVEENSAAIAAGPLDQSTMTAIDELLAGVRKPD